MDPYRSQESVGKAVTTGSFEEISSNFYRRAPMKKTEKEIIGAKHLAGEGSLLAKRERRRTLKPIDVCFGLSGRNEPLVTFVKSPLAFCDMQLGPQQLRKIAAVLIKIADDSEALGLNPGEQRRSYPLGE